MTSAFKAPFFSGDLIINLKKPNKRTWNREKEKKVKASHKHREVLGGTVNPQDLHMF